MHWLFLDNQDIIYTAFSSLFVQQIVMVLLGTVLCCLGARLIRIPVRYLVPCIMVFAIVGAFASRNAIFDAGLMIMFSALGFLMKKNNFPIVPVILGILLGPIADAELLRVLQAYDNFWQIFAEPIVVVLFVISLACILLPVIMKKRRQKQGVEPQ